MVAKCPLCNHDVETFSNHRHSHLCANAHRPYSQWLGADSGYPVYPHPDETDFVPLAVAEDEEPDPILTGGFSNLVPDIPELDIPDTSTPDTSSSDDTFSGGGGFGGGGGGDSW